MCWTIVLLLLVSAAPLMAQEPAIHAGDRYEIFTNSELERYLRVLQLTGAVPVYPWSLRGFSAPELDDLLPRRPNHPWAERHPLAARAADAPTFTLLAPTVESYFNSASPSPDAGGAVWAGRGITLAGRAGFAARYGPFSMTLAPIAFWAQNADFDLVPNGTADERVFQDPYRPGGIDLPQRFGDRPYARIDWGQSTLRADLFGVAAGVSTADQQWGPALRYPIVLGSNAGGFPHAFLGTTRPVSLGIGAIHGRLLWGGLAESPYSPASPEQSRRMMNGLVGVVTIRGIPGLEIGGARFFHSRWPAEGIGLADVLKPFESLLKTKLANEGANHDGSDPDNQLASLFARWVFPASGVEIHGEFAREDHNLDWRDLVLEPDHDSAFLIGMQKAWQVGDGGVLALRAEVVDAQLSHLMIVRDQSRFYGHNFNVQGHTHRGKLLGSPAVYGGMGALIGIDRHEPAGRWTVELERVQQGERPPAQADPAAGDLDRALEVGYMVRGERLIFRNRFDLLVAVQASYDLNRIQGPDEFGIGARVGVRALW